MNALRRQNIRPQQTFERWTPRKQESPHELARQSEPKRKQAPQSEVNVCRHKCKLKETYSIICTNPGRLKPHTKNFRFQSSTQIRKSIRSDKTARESGFVGSFTRTPLESIA